MTVPKIGIYEKAFSSELGWEERLETAVSLHFDFMEIAIDATPERLSRLDWSPTQRASLRKAINNTGIPIYNIVLSAHRTYPLGSASPTIRRQARNILKKAIDFAVDIGIRVIQLAGYYVFDEPHHPQTRERFCKGLQQGVYWASQAGVMLGLENMDGEDILSLDTAMEFIRAAQSPWLKLYPDIGNLSANHLDVCTQLQLSKNHIIGIHLKDTTPGSFRRVQFGNGTVPFADAFQTLANMNYSGPFTLEMWNDNAPDAIQIVATSKDWILNKMKAGSLINVEEEGGMPMT